MLHFQLLLTTTALLTPALAANTTAVFGTNYKIISNHTVVAGDNLANIGTSIRQHLNHEPTLISVGAIIKLPDVRFVALVASPLTEQTATFSNGTASTIKVVVGDTMIIIAKEKLGITLPSLLAANPQVKNLDLISVRHFFNVPLFGKNRPVTATASSKASKATKTKPRKFVSLREWEWH